MIARDDDPRYEVARFYTRSRKFPRMIGRLPEGTRIWGGPYTFAQLGAAMMAGALVLSLRPVLSTGSIVLDLLIAAGVAWAAASGARVVPTSPLNPAVVAGAVLCSAFGPRLGVYRGRAVRHPRPKRVPLSGAFRARHLGAGETRS